MPSNKEYIEQAQALAAELDVAVTTDGLTNEQLARLVSDLKAEALAKETTASEAERKDNAAVQKDEPKKLPPYYVKPGKALTTKRGIKSDGQEITAEDLIGGKEALEGFVKSGHVGKG